VTTTIPAEAVEAAARAIAGATDARRGFIGTVDAARIALESAAPILQAHALRDRAQSLRELWPTPDEMGVAVWLESRADELETK